MVNRKVILLIVLNAGSYLILQRNFIFSEVCLDQEPEMWQVYIAELKTIFCFFPESTPQFGQMLVLSQLKAMFKTSVVIIIRLYTFPLPS